MTEPPTIDPGNPTSASRLLHQFTFGVDGSGQSLRREGWSSPEEGFNWTIGTSSRLELPVIGERRPLQLDMVVSRPGGFPTISGQVLVVRANSHVLGRFVISRQMRFSCVIPVDQYEPDKGIAVSFEHPCCFAMQMLSPGGDARPLAVSVFTLAVGFATTTDSGEPDMERIKPLTSTGETLPTARNLIARSLGSRTGGAQQPAKKGSQGETTVIDFGPRMHGQSTLGGGWRLDDDGCAVTSATVSELTLSAPMGGSDYRLRMDVTPTLVHRLIPRQFLSVIANGCVIGQFRLADDAYISMPLPDELWQAGGTLVIHLVCPHAIVLREFAASMPSEFIGITLDRITIEPAPPHLRDHARVRLDQVAGLSGAVASARFLDEELSQLPATIAGSLGSAPSEFMRDFESLGNNCAFGLAQRKSGVEVLGLLRFANTPLKWLLAGLADLFQAVRKRENITLRLADDGNPREYMAYVKGSRIRWHTMVHEDIAGPDQVLAEQSSKLVYLQRRFLEGMRASRKIYVYGKYEPRKYQIVAPARNSRQIREEDPVDLLDAEAMALLFQINRQGRNTLLVVRRAKAGKPSGSAELMLPGLICGYLDSFVISAEVDIHDHADWMRMCANAWVLDQGPNSDFRAGEME